MSYPADLGAPRWHVWPYTDNGRQYIPRSKIAAESAEALRMYAEAMHPFEARNTTAHIHQGTRLNPEDD